MSRMATSTQGIGAQETHGKKPLTARSWLFHGLRHNPQGPSGTDKSGPPAPTKTTHVSKLSKNGFGGMDAETFLRCTFF